MGLFSHALSLGRLCQQVMKSLGDLIGRTGVYEITCFAIHNDLRQTTLVGCNDRNLPYPGLGSDQPEGLSVPTGDDEDIQSVIDGCYIPHKAVPVKMTVKVVERSLLLHRIHKAIFTAPVHITREFRFRCITSNNCKGRNQVFVSFPLANLPDNTDPRCLARG